MDHAARRRDLLEARPDAAAVAVTPGPSLRYLTGYQFNRDAHGHDAPFLYVLGEDGEAGAVLPALETDTAGDALDAALYTYETPAGAEAAVADLLADLDPGAPLGVEEHRLRLLELDLLAARWDRSDLVDVTDDVAALRARKDDEEVAALREAAGHAEAALAAAIEQIEPGMTEHDVDAVLQTTVVEGEADAYGVGVVTSGERTAVNYTSSTDRTLQDGDLVLMDTGAVVDGYWADVTRTVAIGDPVEQLREIYGAVREAQAAAREAAAPGMTAAELDGVAREQIADAGYGEAFLTDLGHGIGLEAHEAPALAPENDRELEAGNVATVEPGIYEYGLGGVRIEDEVVLTAEGSETLTSLPRALRTL